MANNIAESGTGGASPDLSGEGISRVRVCDEDQIPTGRYRCFTVGLISFLVCNVGGRMHAIINRCTHMNQLLDGGRQFGKDFICPVHGARFDIATGKALSGAAVASLKTFPVLVERGSVIVELPTATF